MKILCFVSVMRVSFEDTYGPMLRWNNDIWDLWDSLIYGYGI